MEPSEQFQTAVLTLLHGSFSRPVYDNIPENEPLPYVAWYDETWLDESVKDIRAWMGTFTFEVFDLDEVGRIPLKRLLSELAGLLHGLGETDLLMPSFRLNWIAYQASSVTRASDDSRFRGTIAFSCRLESLEESST